MKKTGLLLLILGGLVLAALAWRDWSAQPLVTESLLNRSVGGEPESLDPHRVTSTQGTRVLQDISEGLIAYSADGQLIAAAAADWDISEDGLVYTFRLRPEARWSNGDPVLAGHFVRGMQRLVDPATAAINSQSVVEVQNATAILAGEMPVDELGVSAPQDRVLVIRLNRPVPYFLGLLTHPSMVPLHPEALEQHGNAFTRPGNYITNGAYRLVDWQLGSFIELERNEYYRANEDTAIDRVRHFVAPEPTVELSRFRAGELHITDNISPEDFTRMLEERPDEVHVSPFLNVYYYGFNLTREPFMDNPKLRQALSMAIDRVSLTKDVIGRGEQPAFSFIPPGVYNYEPQQLAFASMSKREREEQARRLYREAGYSTQSPLEVELRYNTSEVHNRIAVAIQSMWKEVLGFEATLVNEEFQVLLANMLAREVTQVFRSGWSGDYNDGYAFLQIMLTNNPSNLTGYSDAEFDRLMQQAAEQTNPERRRLYLEEAEKIMLRDHPIIPLYFYVSKHMVSNELQGWQDNVLDYHYSQHLSFRPDE